jgi:hypothetical protein
MLFGLTALLHQWRILTFGQSWPLYLILWGVFSLAERAAFYGVTPPPPPAGYPGYPYAGAPYASASYPGTASAGAAPYPGSATYGTSAPGTSLVQQPPAELARPDHRDDDPDSPKGGR